MPHIAYHGLVVFFEQTRLAIGVSMVRQKGQGHRHSVTEPHVKAPALLFIKQSTILPQAMHPVSGGTTSPLTAKIFLPKEQRSHVLDHSQLAKPRPIYERIGGSAVPHAAAQGRVCAMCAQGSYVGPPSSTPAPPPPPPAPTFPPAPFSPH